MDLVADPAKLLRRRHAGRPGADDGHPLAGLLLRRERPDEARLIGLVGDRLLDRLDGDGDVLEVQRACLLAGRRTDPPGELGEVVGRVEVADRTLPVAVVDEVVPVRDLVVDRAARRTMAVGHAAIHAARGLLLDLLVGHRQRELAEMSDTVGSRLVLVHLPVDLEETCNLAHVSPSGRKAPAARAAAPPRSCCISTPPRRPSGCAPSR